MKVTVDATKVDINSLEWNRFLDLASKEARTEPAKARLLALTDPEQWAGTIAAARQLQQETLEITPLLDRDALWGPLFELTDPADSLDRLARGSVLELTELNLIRRWLYAVDSWVQVPRDEIRGERIKKALTQLGDPFEPLRVLDRILTPEGELSEKASPRLAQLYAEIRTLKRDIGIVLDGLVKTLSTKGVLQENFSDVRDGRYVIPVKISNQGDVDGIIYEASASRQTVFVEPREVAPLNNRLRQRQNDLIQEIYIVLEATSKQLRPFAPELLVAVQVLTHWDSVQARARLGRHFAGKPIQVTEERTFRLQQTAHPLLWWSLPQESIIRNDLEFGEPVRTLLLTGPNTGGKTVLLKTLGLAGICARTGFPFPATGNPQVPFFDSFFADLGDPQSIEQHLSSFSGHVARFKQMLESISNQSLVLLDELNSATDPEEGAALGRALLETVMARGSIIVTTTHDPHLKALAISDKRILNASMAFDEGARTPTYRMVLGVPGRSRALETAERLGLPQSVLELARSYLSREHNEFEKMLAKLQADVQEAAVARKQTVAIREEAEKLRREWTEKTQSSVNELLDKTRQKLRRVVEQAQDEVRQTVRKLDEMKHRRDLDQTRGQLNETLGTAADLLETAFHEEAPELVGFLKHPHPAPPPEELKAKLAPGMNVRIPKWKSTGTLLELLSGNQARVTVGTMQMTLSIQDIEPTQEPARRQPTGATGASSQASSQASGAYVPPQQLDLRGKRFDDAMSELEQYLDLVFRSGNLVEATIVHGMGTGALREGTRKLLHRLPYIKAFRDGGIGQGGAGATIVEFDRD